jgi:hypothetical protein
MEEREGVGRRRRREEEETVFLVRMHVAEHCVHR